tara:strand:+ start:221 stop:406 length:186 start_codon:yes stop_codon:yes gene_type:complete
MMSKYFNKYFELAVVAIIIAIFLWTTSVVFGQKAKIAKLYAECITTDYDKFQCYSMIYGGR